MANAHDVAAYIARNCKDEGELDAIKLQKLVYYSQAWHLVAHDRPLFPEAIRAFKHGPVVGVLWHDHRGQRTVTAQNFVAKASGELSTLEAEVIDAVLGAYGSLSAWELVELTHRERPWVHAWDHCEYDDRIPLDDIKRFYAMVSAIPRELVDSPVPSIPSASVWYLGSQEFSEIADNLDKPDDASGLLAAVRAAQARQGE